MLNSALIFDLGLAVTSHPSAYRTIKHTSAEETKMTVLANALPHTPCLEKHILRLDACGSPFMFCMPPLKWHSYKVLLVMKSNLSVLWGSMRSLQSLDSLDLTVETQELSLHHFGNITRIKSAESNTLRSTERRSPCTSLTQCMKAHQLACTPSLQGNYTQSLHNLRKEEGGNFQQVTTVFC